MTPFPVRTRPRRATAHRSVRVAHALLGGAAGVMWLVLPLTAARGGPPAAPGGDAPATSAPARERSGGGTPGADLVLPLVTAGTVCALAGYGRVRRVRRARTRTTPGGTPTGAYGDIPVSDDTPAYGDTRACDDTPVAGRAPGGGAGG